MVTDRPVRNCAGCGVEVGTHWSRKWCDSCRKRADLDAARRHRRAPKSAEQIEANKARQRRADSNRRHIKQQYRAKQLERLIERHGQPTACGICGDVFSVENKPRWDHNHGTGEFRGWLCHRCNVSLGLLGDSPALLGRAITYLESRGYTPKRGPL